MEIFKLAQSYKIDWGLVLDGKVYEVLSAHAQSLGCELDLFMLPLFVSAANFMGPKTKIQITQSWIERPSLMGIVAARRGERKTTVLNFIKSCSRRVQTETRVTKEEETRSTETGLKDAMNVDGVTETCNVNGSRLFVIDDLDEVMKQVTKAPDFWNSYTLQKSVLFPYSDASYSENINVAATVQGAQITEIINWPDPGRLLDRVLILCARDSEEMTFSLKQCTSLHIIFQRVHELYNNNDITYTFSDDALQELERMAGVVNSIKKECHNDELKRGCANHVMSQTARLSAVSHALTHAVSDSRSDYVISKTTVQGMFVICLYMLRQKCLLLHGSDSAGYSQLFHSILSSEVELLKPTEVRNAFNSQENGDDVIEITLDGNNEPVARIIPKREDKEENPSMEASSSSDVTIWQMESRDRDENQTERSLSSMYYPGVQTSQQQIIEYQKQHGMMTTSPSRETVNLQHYEPDQLCVSKNESPKQDNMTSVLRPRGKFRPPPPPLKPRPHQLHMNRRFIPAPKRLNDRTQHKTCVFTCSDNIFVQICFAKIRKCLLTKGLFITSSYACQYRLFPPVPLVQRTSSPRTTHPSWAAVKFFERLETLGFGEVTVFRSQSVKFKKKPLEEMSERARNILKQVGIAEDEYISALTTDDDVSLTSLPEYNYLFTVNQNGNMETEDAEEQVQVR